MKLLRRITVLLILGFAIVGNVHAVSRCPDGGSSVCYERHDAAQDTCWNQYAARITSDRQAQTIIVGCLASIYSLNPIALAGCVGYLGQAILADQIAFGDLQICTDVAASNLSGCVMSCILQEKTTPLNTTGSSPIVINFGKGTVAFSSPADGVAFDVNADGIPENIGWLDRADEAFLVLDRTSNGTIDNGLELFGNATEQPDSNDRNGFRALRAFDGNGDGILSAADAVFPHLQLWFDRDRDAVTDAGELEPLRERVTVIELDYTTAARRDQFGNQIRWFSHVILSDGSRRPDIVDVLFATSAE